MRDVSSRESGNVLFILLIVVVLFGALSFAVSNMMRGGDGAGGISQEKLQLTVSEILNYGRVIRQVVQDLRISNACDLTEISFEHPQLSGYTPVPAARDECKIFHPQGGSMGYPRPLEEWLETAESGNSLYGEWYLSGNDRVVNLGDSATPDLIVFLPWISAQMCEAINEKLGIEFSNNAAVPFVTSNKFVGAYDVNGVTIGTTITDLQGKTTGCWRDSANNRFFYQVLASR